MGLNWRQDSLSWPWRGEYPTLEEIVASIRLLADRNSVIAEGAGAASVAAALSGQAGSGKVVCIVSGGNIDAGKLARILSGEIPQA